MTKELKPWEKKVRGRLVVGRMGIMTKIEKAKSRARRNVGHLAKAAQKKK